MGALMALSSACWPDPTCAGWLDLLVEERREEQARLFADLSIEDKYVVVLCESQYVHPSPYRLTLAFVDMGDEVIPFLQEKLVLESDDFNIRDIVHVLTLMHPNVANLHDHPGLVPLMHARAAQISAAGLRRTVLGMIDRAGL